MNLKTLFSKKVIPSTLLKLFFLTFLCLLTSCASQKTIVNGLDEKEANEILVFLASKGINATKVPKVTGGGGGGGGVALYDISVDATQATEAMAVLNANGLPRRRGQNLLGLFQAGGLVPTDLQEKIRYQAGLAEQIASIIRKIDGVLDADVQLSFPEEDPLNPGKTIGKVTSSVYVKHSGVLDDPNSHLITKIKRLVASSVNGLDFDNVTVISDRARFSDVTFPEQQATNPEESKDYVRVWSMVIGKESIGRFRAVFFSMILIILLLTLVALWLGWKLIPMIKEQGFKDFFSPPAFVQKLIHKKTDSEKKAAADEKKATEEKKVDEKLEKPAEEAKEKEKGKENNDDTPEAS